MNRPIIGIGEYVVAKKVTNAIWCGEGFLDLVRVRLISGAAPRGPWGAGPSI